MTSLPHLLEESREKIWESCWEYTDDGAKELSESKVEEYCLSLIKKAYALGKKDGIAHASFLVAKHDPQTGYDVSPVYWGQTLRKDLIDEEVSLAKQLKGQSITSEPSPEKGAYYECNAGNNCTGTEHYKVCPKSPEK